mmetsp:Transcript_7383/g.27004  ORF Transcript_7383/g.27004 Transcript_7383/m.27004 type:complete len:214 (-) Transcript_7383:414-1055(-)
MVGQTSSRPSENASTTTAGHRHGHRRFLRLSAVSQLVPAAWKSASRTGPCPCLRATSTGVAPCALTSVGRAPARSSSAQPSCQPKCAAHIRAVQPPKPLRWLTSACRSISREVTSGAMKAQATMSTERPALARTSGDMPASRYAATARHWPAHPATCPHPGMLRQPLGSPSAPSSPTITHPAAPGSTPGRGGEESPVAAHAPRPSPTGWQPDH